MARLIVPYEHDPADHNTIFLSAVKEDTSASTGGHVPAFRDTIDGKRVVWIDTELTGFVHVWLRDKRGTRSLGQINLGTE